jgi:hypothetical protein
MQSRMKNAALIHERCNRVKLLVFRPACCSVPSRPGLRICDSCRHRRRDSAKANAPASSVRRRQKCPVRCVGAERRGSRDVRSAPPPRLQELMVRDMRECARHGWRIGSETPELPIQSNPTAPKLPAPTRASLVRHQAIAARLPWLCQSHL